MPSPKPKAAFKIVAVVGARPNFVKIASLVRALDAEPSIHCVLVHTGQHYDPSLSDVFFEQLGIRAPDVNLEIGSGSHARQTAAVMTAFEPILESEKPDCVIVVGDINSTLACALTARKMNISVAHVEAGLRSRDDTMPEETNRRVTDLISDLFFTTSAEAGRNLLNENVAADRIHFVGNIMIDSLVHNLDRARSLDVAGEYGLKKNHYALLTLHRPSNVDNPAHFERLIKVFTEIQKHTPVLFIAHPRTRRMLKDMGWLEEKDVSAKVVKTSAFLLASPVGYLEMINLQMNARLVLTDSGGMQEETTVLNVPCLTLRENTERPETVTVGTNQVIGVDPDVILKKSLAILNGDRKNGTCPELWDGNTGSRIAQRLMDYLKKTRL
jgi:UDP-N-acetylglucosamine 2-epimerase (non-hydrolysing)